MRRAALTSLLALGLAAATLPVLGASPTLAWDPSPSAGVTGYKIHYGTASGVYDRVVSVTNATTVTIPGLAAGTTFYFGATAVDGAGLESDLSNEATYSAVRIPYTNYVEAESGALAAPMAAAADANAANGQYVYSPTDGSGSVTFSLNVPQDDDYVVWCRFRSQDNGEDSFFVALDGGTEDVYGTTSTYSPNWQWGLLNGVTAGNPRLLTLSAGVHSLAFRCRESNTLLDALYITNDRNFAPSGGTVPTNAPPTLDVISNVAVNEDAGAQGVVLSGISSGSALENQTLTVAATSSNPGLIPNPAVNYTSPNTSGTLSFTPVANGFGSATITVTVNDGQPQNNSITRTFTVTVNGVNDAPTLNALANRTLNANDPQQTVALAGISSGAANESQTLTVTATSSNPGLIPTPTVTYTSPATSGSLRFTPVANATGLATITVTVNDGQAQNNTVVRTFTVTVNSVANGAPTISAISDQTINANESTPAVPFTVGDSTTPAANLTLSSSSSNPTLVPNDNVQNIVFGGSGANRTVTVTPAPDQSGEVDLTVTVSDGSLTRSTTFHVSVLDVLGRQPPTVTLVTNGVGTISPDLSGQTLTEGNTYTVTATAGPGFEFAGWTGSYPSSSNSLTFVLTSNVVLQANFSTNAPFTLTSGNFNGLFYQGDLIEDYSSGAFTVSLNTRGAYSGRVQIGAHRFSFRGVVDGQGRGTNFIKRGKDVPLTLGLRFGRGGLTDQVEGSLTDGKWVANLSGDLAVYSAKNPTPLAGTYTLVLPGNTNAAGAPTADGFGAIKVNANGRAAFAGTLADGSKLSQSSPVSKAGDWPFYLCQSGGKACLLSWLALTNGPGTNVSGLVSWIKQPDSRAKYYPSGFTTETTAIGSIYQRPAYASGILDLGDGTATVVFSGGNLGSSITNQVGIGMSASAANLSAHKLSFNLAVATGLFKGTLADPITGKSMPFGGAVLQHLNAGFGVLLGSDKTSEVSLQP